MTQSLRIYQIDAFTQRVFGGNPAAVCPLETWIPERVMQRIAAENNVSETAFLVPTGDGYEIRWFTPVAEVDLCGHATLASAFIVFRNLEPAAELVRFQSRSGPLSVLRETDGRLTLDFPAWSLTEVSGPEALIEALGTAPAAIWAAERDYLVVYDREEQVASLKPDFARLGTSDRLGTVVTAPGRDVDFVSRFFAPTLGVPEDPVTGSAHCALTPYWAERLGRTTLRARQISARGGELWCELANDRVRISGHAVIYLEGTLQWEDHPAGSRE